MILIATPTSVRDASQAFDVLWVSDGVLCRSRGCRLLGVCGFKVFGFRRLRAGLLREVDPEGRPGQGR